MLTEKEYREVRKKVDRTWSGNISPPKPKESTKGGSLALIKANHRRVHSAGNLPYPTGSEPKLVRSSGMRRDWSFENLTAEQQQQQQQQDQRVSCH